MIKATDKVSKWGGSGNKYLLSIIVLFVVLAILFYQSLFLGKGLVASDGIFVYPPWREQIEEPISNYLLRDQYLNFVPHQHWLYEQIRNGNFSLWNPHLACGVPTIASMQTAVFSPLNLALSYIEPFRANGLKAFLKLFLAGLFMLLYVRRLGLGRLAALFSAVVFSMCSFMIVWLGHPHTNCAMWFPLLLYFIEVLFAEPDDEAVISGMQRHKWVLCWIGFAVAYCFMIFGGHPPTVIHISIITGVYFLFRLISNRKKGKVGFRILFFATSIGFGLLLAAPQLLPFIEYYLQSSTGLSSAVSTRTESHLHFSALSYLLTPNICGSPVKGLEWLQQFISDSYNFNERTIFVGVMTLFLSVFAAVFRKRKVVIFYFVLFLVCMSVVFGVWPFSKILASVPIVRDVNNLRLILFVCFSLAVLAGFGLEGIITAKRRVRLVCLFGAWAVAIVFLVLVFISFKPVFNGENQQAKGLMLGQLHVLFATLGVFSIVSLYPYSRSKLVPQTAALVWVCFELLWFGMGYNPSVSKKYYYPETDGIRFLKQDKSIFRVASLDSVLPANTAAVFGLYDIRGQDFMSVLSYEEFIRGKAGHFFFYSPTEPLPRRPEMLNVKYILTDKERVLPQRPVYKGEISIYRVEPFVERAFLVFDYEVLSERSQILQKVRSEDFDLLEVVVLERQPAIISSGSEEGSSDIKSGVEITSYDSDAVVIEVSTEKPGFLVLCDTYYPGWKAYINGERTEIYRANYNFRAVCVPAGESVVRFAYRPSSFTLGCSLSLGSMIFMIGMFIYSRKRNIFVF